jgi:hypothetical protein
LVVTRRKSKRLVRKRVTTWISTHTHTSGAGKMRNHVQPRIAGHRKIENPRWGFVQKKMTSSLKFRGKRNWRGNVKTARMGCVGFGIMIRIVIAGCVAALFALSAFAKENPSTIDVEALVRSMSLVSFNLTALDLAFVNADSKLVTEPGKFEVLIGNLEAEFDYEL